MFVCVAFLDMANLVDVVTFDFMLVVACLYIPVMF